MPTLLISHSFSRYLSLGICCIDQRPHEILSYRRAETCILLYYMASAVEFFTTKVGCSTFKALWSLSIGPALGMCLFTKISYKNKAPDCTTPLSKPFLSKFFFFRIVCRIYVWTKFLCLRKVCLRNLCLRKVSLRKVCLRNMCLRKKSLSNVCLSKVCLRKVCLRNVCLRKVCLRQVCLESYTNFS